MTLTLYDTIQHIVQQELGRLRTAELAVVQDQHPHSGAGDQDNYACTIKLRNSGLVLKQVPVATGRIGLASIPAVGDLVLVQFVAGDINAPIITGSLYNDEDRPPVNADGQLVMHLPLAAGDGDAVHVEVHSGDSRQIVIKLGSTLQATLQDDDPVIEFKVGSSAKIQVGSDGAITLESQGDIKIHGTNVSVEADAQLELKASGPTTLKGATVNIN